MASSSSAGQAGGQSLTPILYVIKTLYATGAPYRAVEQAVVMAVVARMNKEGVSWPSLKDIARRTHLSIRGVSKVLKEHLDGPAPLLAATWTPRHKSRMYSLVRNPAKFAAARDAQRAPKNVVPPKTRGGTARVNDVPPKTQASTDNDTGMHDVPPANERGAPHGGTPFHPPMNAVPPKTSIEDVHEDVHEDVRHNSLAGTSEGNPNRRDSPEVANGKPASLLEAYAHLWSRQYHVRPDVSSGDLVLASKLFRERSAQDLDASMRFYFVSPDDFYAQKLHPFALFAKNVGRLLSEARRAESQYTAQGKRAEDKRRRQEERTAIEHAQAKVRTAAEDKWAGLSKNDRDVLYSRARADLQRTNPGLFERANAGVVQQSIHSAAIAILEDGLRSGFRPAFVIG